MKPLKIFMIIVVLGILFAGATWMGGGYGYGYGWGHNGWHMGPGGAMGMMGMGPVMILFWILLLFGMIMLISWIARLNQMDRQPPCDRREDEAVQVLRQRYARGEIDKTEFDARLFDLQHMP